jgi:hypothetical protein
VGADVKVERRSSVTFDQRTQELEEEVKKLRSQLEVTKKGDIPDLDSRSDAAVRRVGRMLRNR